MFRFPRILLAVLTVSIALLCAGAYAQGLFGNQQPGAVPARPSQPASAVETRFNKGLQLMRQGKTDQAIAEFQAAKKLQPNNPAILVNLGVCYMQKKNLSAAEAAFKQVVALDPKGKAPATKFAYARLIGLLSARKKDAEALAMAKKYVAIAPKDYDAQFVLGVCHLGAKNYSAAASAFRAALAIKPNDPAASQNLGFAYINGKNYAAARKFFEQALTRKEDPQYRAMAAFSCEQMGDKKAALAHYDKIAWKRLPQSPQAVMSMVRIHNSLNKPGESASVLKKAAAIYKKDYGINAELGRLMMAQRKFKEAETALLAARKVKSDVLINLNLAVIEINLNKPNEAGTYVQLALKQDPKNKQGLDLYAYLLSSKGKNDDAIAQYRKWEKYYPTDASANTKIGGMLMMQGKNDLAYKEYEKAMKKAPKDPAVMAGGAAALRSMGRVDDAIALLQKAVTTEPKYEPAMAALAEIYETQDKTDLAIEQYKKMLAVSPKSKQTLQRLAGAYEAKKDYPSAIEQYRKLYEIDPKDTESAIAVARMYDKADQLDMALAEIKKVAEAHPDADTAHVFYGDMLAKKKDYAAALAQYEILTKSKEVPTKSYGYFKIAGVYEEQGKHDEAIAAYKTCIEGVPSSKQALDALAKVYDDQKKSDEFLAYIKTMVETGKDDAPYEYFISKYKDAGKAEEAAATVEGLAAKNPDVKTLQAQLPEAYKAAGQYDKAIEHYKSMLAKNKDDLMLEMALCDIYKTADKNQEAVDALKSLIVKVPNYAKLHIDLGDVYVKMKNKAEAEAAYNAALKLQPSNEQIKDKIKALNPPPPAVNETTPAGETAPATASTPAPAPAPTADPVPDAAPAAK